MLLSVPDGATGYSEDWLVTVTIWYAYHIKTMGGFIIFREINQNYLNGHNTLAINCALQLILPGVPCHAEL